MPANDYKLKEIINQDPWAKTAATIIENTDNNGSDESLLLLERLPWSPNQIQSHLDELSDYTLVERNDKYSKLKAPSAMLTLISPATAQQIAKHRTQKRSMLPESPEAYAQFTRPFYESVKGDLQWIDNVLYGKAESPVAKFPGWTIIPDLKWPTPYSVSQLYLLALHDNGGEHRIVTMRDLRGEHLPLLIGLEDNLEPFLQHAYKLRWSDVRCYLHYLPTFGHLHVHIVSMEVERPHGQAIGQAHLLEEVIDSLKRDSDHYAKVIMRLCIGEEHPLHDKLLPPID